MRVARCASLIGAGLVVVVVTAGCHVGACVGSGCDNAMIDTAKAQTTTRTLIAAQTGARVKSVACPSHVALKQGAAFTCTATGADGTTATILVTQKDGKGNVQISAPNLLHTGAAAKLIAAGLTGRVKTAIHVRCPDLIDSHKGTTLTCRATDPRGAVRSVAVTVTDNRGGIFYRLR